MSIKALREKARNGEVIDQEEFLRVFCIVHQEIPASYYLKSSFAPICESCTQATDSPYSPLSYLDIETTFFSLFHQFKSKLCKQRKKSLIPSSFSSLLKSCIWLNSLSSGPTCSFHPLNLSKFIDSNLTCYCDLCTSSSRNLDINTLKNLENIEETGHFILDLAKNKAKETRFMNTYMIGQIVIKNQHGPKDRHSLMLLLLEAQDLFRKAEIFNIDRCIKCVRSTSVGNKLGIVLNCGHVMCFGCISSDFSEYCPVDYKETKYSEFENLKFRDKHKYKYKCHEGHMISDNSVIRLNCLHYSCKPHSLETCCLECGFEEKLFPSSRKERNIEDYNNFISFICHSHRKQITKLQIFPMSLCCDSCIYDQSCTLEINKKLVNSNKIQSIFLERLMNIKQIQSIEELKHFYQENFLKLAPCLQLLPIYKLQLFDEVKKVFLGLSVLKSTFFLYFFKELYPKQGSESKALALTEISEFSIELIPKNDLILTSLIIADQYIIIPSFNSPIIINQVSVKVFDKKSGIEKQNISFAAYLEEDVELRKNVREYVLGKSIYLTHINRYEISFSLNQGKYFSVAPFSRLKQDLFSFLKFSGKINGRAINFAGPLVGFGIFDLSTLTKPSKFI